MMRQIKTGKTVVFIVAFLLILQLCGCNKFLPDNTIANDSIDRETTGTNETTSAVSSVPDQLISSQTTDYSSDTPSAYYNDFVDYLKEIPGYYYVQFSDIDLDGNVELLLALSDGKSFGTMIYTVYKLYENAPQLYGRIDLESSKSEYSQHTICEGKLQRYYDWEKGVYVIISDATRWDDGSFGNVQYSAIGNTLYSDRIVSKTLKDFSGTPCVPAQYIRENKVTDYSYIDEWNFVYYNDVFDLNGTEKFVDVSDAVKNIEFIDTIDLNSLPQYKDIDEISGLIAEYSGYRFVNEKPSPSDDNEYIGIIGMGNHKICKSDTDAAIEIRDVTELDWNKILEISDLHSLVLHYYGDETIDIDLSALKKYQKLTTISLPDNISESTKRQISELTALEYVNKWSIVISSEEDFGYIMNLPNLKYIAVASDNDDPDYFKFLYENQSIEWIRFAESVTDEQIKQIVDNMPNLKAVTFGFSEV